MRLKNLLMIMYAKSVGGAELQFLELANYLANNHSVRLLCLGGDGAIKNATVDKNVDVRVYPYNSKIGVLCSFVKVIIRNAKFADSIVTTSFFGNVLGFLIGVFSHARLTSLQTVSICMSHPTVDRFVLRKFDALIAGANDIKAYLVKHGQSPDKIHVVHNWVDFSKRVPRESVEETKAKLNIKGCTLVGCIGRLHPQKGQIYLVRAFAGIAQKHSNAILLLVGEGSTRQDLENEVHNLDLSNTVVFAGTVAGDDYNNILQAIDIYVQPSVFEGLPRTLLDAMYMGKAIIAASVNGNREAIKNNENGLLVPSEDVEALESAITRLIEDNDLKSKISSQSISTANARFGMEEQLKKIDSII